MHIPFVGTSLSLLSSTLQILENDLVDTADLVCIVGKKASEMWNMYKRFRHVQLNCRRPRLAVCKFYWFTFKKKYYYPMILFFFFSSHGKSLGCIIRIVTNFAITTVKRKKSRELVQVAATWRKKKIWFCKKEGITKHQASSMKRNSR